MGRYRAKPAGMCQWPYGCGERATFANRRAGIYCDRHRAMAAAKRRGKDRHPGKSTKERGYGAEHRKLRAEWAPRVEAGQVRCFRSTCGRLIEPGTPWDLGHDDTDRSRYTGPEHQRCNRATSRHRAERQRRAGPEPRTSRDW